MQLRGEQESRGMSDAFPISFAARSRHRKAGWRTRENGRTTARESERTRDTCLSAAF